MVSKKTVGSLLLVGLAISGFAGCTASTTEPDDGVDGQGGAPSGGSPTGGLSTGGLATGGVATGGISGAAGSMAGTTGLGGSPSGGTAGLGGASGIGPTGGAAGMSGSASGGGAGSSCPANQILCGPTCVDGTSDPANCGTCGTACSGGRTCMNGTCGCPNGGTVCNNACVDTQTSPMNCGSCGMTCPSGQLCSMGRCATSCASGQTVCNGACVNTMTSATNCGSCGNACSGGRSCSAGMCACPTGQSFCNNACINTQTDVANCGICGRACTSGQTCSNGTCMGGSTTSGVIGWAAVSGSGVTTTTGGSTSNTVDVSTASALSSAASSGTSQVIRLTASVSVSNLNVASNKTIIGVGSNIVISGGIEINNRQNVILQNFRLNAASSGVSAGDGIRITNSHHVWIDHLEVYDAQDGNLDITDRSNFITVSWTKFRYSVSTGDHRYSNLIGAGDNETGDEALLNVTWHHNWWAQNVHERMPRVRFGDVHVFNNYYSSSGNNYCIRAGFHSNVLIENNHFQGVDTPHELGEDQGTAIVTARGNLYSSTTGAQGTRGTAFTPPYPYTLDAASSVSAAVQSGAGPH